MAKASLLEKLTNSEKPTEKRVGMSAASALNVFKGVLKGRLVLPPDGAGAIWAMMSRRLQMLNLTPMDCTTIAKMAGEQWTGMIKAQSIINQAEVLLQGAEGRTFEDEPAPRKRVDGQAAMDDM